jgi:hypothetical protein
MPNWKSKDHLSGSLYIRDHRPISKSGLSSNPWEIYSHAYDVPESKMGKGQETKMSTREAKALLDSVVEKAHPADAYGATNTRERAEVVEASGVTTVGHPNYGKKLEDVKMQYVPGGSHGDAGNPKWRQVGKSGDLEKDFGYGGKGEIDQMISAKPKGIPNLGVDRASSRAASDRKKAKSKEGPVVSAAKKALDELCNKAYLGEVKIGKEGATFTGSGAKPKGASASGPGMVKPGSEPIAERMMGMAPKKKQGPPPIPADARKAVGEDQEKSFRGGDPEEAQAKKEEAREEFESQKAMAGTAYPTTTGAMGGVVKSIADLASFGDQAAFEQIVSEQNIDKALSARSMPRVPRAIAQEMIRRNAMNVMTRGNSRFAATAGTAPLNGEVIDDVRGNADPKLKHLQVYKSCNSCGRRYTLSKGVDSGCPTCSISKSQHCSKCQSFLVKSHGGRKVCPICG